MKLKRDKTCFAVLTAQYGTLFCQRHIKIRLVIVKFALITQCHNKTVIRLTGIVGKCGPIMAVVRIGHVRAA